MSSALIILPLLVGAVTRDEEEFVTELRYVPEGWLAVAAVAGVALICWAVVWMYRYEGRRGSSGRTRAALAVLRCMVLVTLGVILLEPIRVRILRRWIDSYTVVLLDSSSSMDLAMPSGVTARSSEACKTRSHITADADATATAPSRGAGSSSRGITYSVESAARSETKTQPVTACARLVSAFSD